MLYRTFGKLGYDVSQLGMGCMRLPRIYSEDGRATVDREKAYELIRYAADHDVNYFDTAFGYHNQTSEEVLGEALEGERRSRVKIATKQPFFVMKTVADIRRNLENTLKKLRTDYIDVYLIHNIQQGSWPKIREREVIREYEKFRDEGLIRAIGFSYHGNFHAFKEILEFYPWDMCQVQQNIIDVDKEVTEQAIRIAGKRGTGLVIMEPLRGGGLACASDSVRNCYDAYPEPRTPAQWAFLHLIDYPQISTILSGMTTMEQLKENIGIFSNPKAHSGCLTLEEKVIIARAKEAYESRATIPCTACEYCLPCPNGVNIPGVFERYNAGSMTDDFANPKRAYMFLERAGQGASNCVECGVCEQKCPQHIKIIQSLKASHNTLSGWVE